MGDIISPQAKLGLGPQRVTAVFPEFEVLTPVTPMPPASRALPAPKAPPGSAIVKAPAPKAPVPALLAPTVSAPTLPAPKAPTPLRPAAQPALAQALKPSGAGAPSRGDDWEFRVVVYNAQASRNLVRP